MLQLPEVVTLLACPRCGLGIDLRRGSLACKNSSCEFAAGYPYAGPWPVLIDSERSTVDVGRILVADGASATNRRRTPGFFREVARRVLTVTNPVTVRNIEMILGLLRPGPRSTGLVVGGGTIGNGVRALYDEPGLDLVSFDIYGSEQTQLVADAHGMPFKEASFDFVLVQAVLEHVLDPAAVIAEVARVLRPGGLIYAETPFLQNVHEGAYDFTRFTESGHRWAFRHFEEVSAGCVLGVGTQLAWSLRSFVAGVTQSHRAGALFFAASSWLGWFDRVVPEKFNLDGASSVYFLGRKSGRQAIGPAEALTRYKGAQA